LKSFLAVLAFVALAGVAGFAFFNNWIEGPKGGGGRPVKVTIERGSSAAHIAETLEESAVVDSAFRFRLYLKKNGINADLRAGKYDLETEQPFPALVAELKKGPPAEFVKLSIPEGSNLEQTAALVEAQTDISAADFMAEATPAKIKPSILPDGVPTLEGFLYPTTYHVDKKETAASLVARMLQEFQKQMSREGLDTSTALGRTPYEMLIIASLIEEEAKVDEERPLISAVIHNRLARGIPLGIDATIQYAVKKYNGEPLTMSDLAINSPFNTRTRPGLPPNPLSSPRASSVAAALSPAQESSLYYVLTSDCIHHVFTADYNEFIRAKAIQPTNC
jgi:UPF0755 protein